MNLSLLTASPYRPPVTWRNKARMTGPEREAQILRLLASGPLKSAEIAKRAGTGHKYVIGILRQMCKAGRVRRELVNGKDCRYSV